MKLMFQSQCLTLTSYGKDCEKSLVPCIVAMFEACLTKGALLFAKKIWIIPACNLFICFVVMFEGFSFFLSFFFLGFNSLNILIDSLEYWSFEMVVLLAGLLPNPTLETSVLSIRYLLSLPLIFKR